MWRWPRNYSPTPSIGCSNYTSLHISFYEPRNHSRLAPIPARSALSTSAWTSATNSIYTVSGGQVCLRGWSSGRTTRLYTHSSLMLRYNFPWGSLYSVLATM